MFKTSNGYATGIVLVLTAVIAGCDRQAKTFSDGTFVVGSDISAGTYRNSGGEGCYYERLRGFGGTFEEIIANGASGSSQTVVTILSTDKGFHSDGCGTWQLVSKDTSSANASTSADASSDPSPNTPADAPWNNLLNDHSCVDSVTAGTKSPANVVEYGQISGQTDDVTVLAAKDGKPVVVIVGEPMGNGMVNNYTFVRGKERCEAYGKQKEESMKGLN